MIEPFATKHSVRFLHFILLHSLLNVLVWVNRDLKTQGRRQKLCLKIKRFRFFQSSSRVFQLYYFVKYRRTLLDLNFKKPYPSWENFAVSYVLHKPWNEAISRHGRAVREKTCKKSVRMHLQSCCFAFLLFLLPSPSSDLKVTNKELGTL